MFVANPTAIPQNLSANIGSSLSWDILVLIVVIGAVFVYGATAGRGRLIIILISTYFSYLITNIFPWSVIGSSGENGLPTPTSQIFLFAAIILAFAFLLPNSILGSACKSGKSSKKIWWQILLLSFLEVGLLASMIFVFLPAKAAADISLTLQQLFLGETALFFWTLAPILALVVLRPGRGDV